MPLERVNYQEIEALKVFLEDEDIGPDDKLGMDDVGRIITSSRAYASQKLIDKINEITGSDFQCRQITKAEAIKFLDQRLREFNKQEADSQLSDKESLEQNEKKRSAPDFSDAVYHKDNFLTRRLFAGDKKLPEPKRSSPPGTRRVIKGRSLEELLSKEKPSSVVNKATQGRALQSYALDFLKKLSELHSIEEEKFPDDYRGFLNSFPHFFLQHGADGVILKLPLSGGGHVVGKLPLSSQLRRLIKDTESEAANQKGRTIRNADNLKSSMKINQALGRQQVISNVQDIQLPIEFTEYYDGISLGTLF